MPTDEEKKAAILASIRGVPDFPKPGTELPGGCFGSGQALAA